MQGQVFNIQRFSIHDGPGIRTTVFLKGCSLNCLWCHNPESIATQPQLQYFPQRCIGCGRCIDVCPAGAHVRQGDAVLFLREQCAACGKCAEACYCEALEMAGSAMTVESVMGEVLKDRSFYSNSGGGVTLSGGEPLVQRAFAALLLEGCKREGLHTAVETAGNVPWESFAAVLPHTDLFLYDLKAFHEDVHRAVTGSSNRRILDNLTRLSKTAVEIRIRIPVVPGSNDIDDEMLCIAGFLEGLSRTLGVEFMPYHRLGEGKNASLGQPNRVSGVEPPPAARIAELAGLFRDKGIPVI